MSERETRQSVILPIVLPLAIVVVIALVLFGFSRILLNTRHTAATVVALVAAVAIVGVAAYVGSRARVSGSSLFSMVGAVTGVAMVVGGLAVIAAPLAEEEGEGPVVTLAAPPGATADGFSTDELLAPAEVPFTLEFDNQETGTEHNVVIFDGQDAESPSLFQGVVTVGPNVTPYAVEPLPVGSYFFHCEIHPTTMTGEVTAEVGVGGEGGESGPPSIVAQGTAFSTSELTFPAETPTPLLFDNQDDVAVAGQHNVSIYDGESALFTGDLIDGPSQVTYDVPGLPAGEYEFRCDVHTTMAGTVSVS